MITGVLYSKKNVKICGVQDFNSNNGKNFNKRSNRFYVHTLADSERLIIKLSSNVHYHDKSFILQMNNKKRQKIPLLYFGYKQRRNYIGRLLKDNSCVWVYEIRIKDVCGG